MLPQCFWSECPLLEDIYKIKYCSSQIQNIKTLALDMQCCHTSFGDICCSDFRTTYVLISLEACVLWEASYTLVSLHTNLDYIVFTCSKCMNIIWVLEHSIKFMHVPRKCVRSSLLYSTANLRQKQLLQEYNLWTRWKWLFYNVDAAPCISSLGGPSLHNILIFIKNLGAASLCVGAFFGWCLTKELYLR